MMTFFDPAAVRFELVKFRGATTALGGAVRILDEAEFKKTKKEVFHRIDAPMAIVRLFLAKYDNPRFLQPTEGCIVYYNDRVIGLELAPWSQENERFVQGLNGMRPWIPQSKINYDQLLQPGMKEGRWFFDGTYAYTFDNMDMWDVARRGAKLTEDGKFRECPCRAVDMTKLNSFATRMEIAKVSKVLDELEPIAKPRSCLAFIANEQEQIFAISPPIWKQIGDSVGQRGKDDDDDGVFSTSRSFTQLDDRVFVNLSFALSCANEISDSFGYESIGALQLPKQMIQLCTVNLPRVVKEIKKTHDIGIRFTDCLAWLMGLMYRAQNENQAAAIRKSMKYLTTKGIYVKARMSAKAIHKDEFVEAEVPLLTPAKALESFTGMSSDQMRTILRALKASGEKVGADVLSGERFV